VAGGDGIRDLGALESALAQPKVTFGSEDLYPSVVEKASALAFGLAMNHPFIDGNKRIAHAAMAVFVDLNGHALDATVDEQAAHARSCRRSRFAGRADGLAPEARRRGVIASALSSR
jgi:prophage maintenance system killer protein